MAVVTKRHMGEAERALYRIEGKEKVAKLEYIGPIYPYYIP